MQPRERQALEMLLAVLSLRGALVDSEPVVLDLPGNPVPKARPRVPRSNAGRYARSDRDERVLAQLMRYAFRAEPVEGPLAAAFLFVRSDRILCDTDNLVKLAKDAGEGVLWRSDAQIEWELSGVEVGPDARTVVAFAALPRSRTSRYLPAR